MGAIAVESLMRARRVVVGEVPAQQASEMPFAEDDDVIEAFPSNRSNHALGIGVLPGRAWGDEDLVDPHIPRSPEKTRTFALKPSSLTTRLKSLSLSTYCVPQEAAVYPSTRLAIELPAQK